MKAVVTGAAGFIGSHLCEHLLTEGADVTGLDCFTDYYPRKVKKANLAGVADHPRFAFIEARIQDADLAGLLDGATHVFHLAAQPGVRKNWGREFRHYTESNIEATQVLLEASARARLDRFVYASSSSVYGDSEPGPTREDHLPHPVSPGGVTKLAAEHLCHLYHVCLGVPAVSVRFFPVYGPRQRPDMAFHRFLKAAAAGHSVHLFGNGWQTRDFTYVADAVRGMVAAGTRGTPGAVYNIGGGSRVSVSDVLALIGRLIGKPLDIRNEANQQGDMRGTCADTTLAKRDLAYVASVGLEEGLEAELRWLSATLAGS